MSFRNKLKSVLVQTLSISHKEAALLLYGNRVFVNGGVGKPEQIIFPEDEICLENTIIRLRKELIYLAYHKPKGVESTLNKKINICADYCLLRKCNVFTSFKL